MTAILHDPLYDADVLGELERALGPAVVDTLVAAFDAELRVRPGIIAGQVATGELENARASAHALQGAALVVGARTVSVLARRIELADAASIGGLAEELMNAADSARR